MWSIRGRFLKRPLSYECGFYCINMIRIWPKVVLEIHPLDTLDIAYDVASAN